MASADWCLPASTEIGGREYRLNTDFRDILEIISYLENERDKQAATLIALALFYEEFEEMPPDDWTEAAQYLEGFIGCFEPEDGRPAPRSIDWEQDYNMISADVNKVAGCEVRMLEYLHWFTFIGYFMSIGEGQLSTVVSIRHKLNQHKQLEKWELDFYRRNKKKVDIKKRYTPEEQAEIDRLNKRLGG
ncbi:bacteriophage Gp15 family protein [Ruminococcaceae bacterium OttesenSCG-928-D13]|nr:bacteriophage Gp15 family protein [Ruminococcaceae bacterium OttesenSCG-928-D13]